MEMLTDNAQKAPENLVEQGGGSMKIRPEHVLM